MNRILTIKTQSNNKIIQSFYKNYENILLPKAPIIEIIIPIIQEKINKY